MTSGSDPATAAALEQLEGWIFDELQLISYKALSLRSGLDADQSKNVLLEFARRHRDRLQLTFFVSGVEAGPSGARRIALVSEAKLRALQAQLAEVTGLHVYAVRAAAGDAAQPSPAADNAEALARDLPVSLWRSEIQDLLRSLHGLSLAQPGAGRDERAADFFRRSLGSAIRNPHVSVRERAPPPTIDAPVILSNPSRSASASGSSGGGSSASSSGLQRSKSAASSSAQASLGSPAGGKRKQAAEDGPKKSRTAAAASAAKKPKPAPKSQIGSMFAKQIAAAEAREASSVATLDDDEDEDEENELNAGRDHMDLDTEEEEDNDDSSGGGSSLKQAGAPARKAKTKDANALMRSLQMMGQQVPPTKPGKHSISAKPAGSSSKARGRSSDVSDEEEDGEGDSDLSDYSRQERAKKSKKAQAAKASKTAGKNQPKQKRRRLTLDESDDDDNDEVIAGSQPEDEEVTYSDLEGDQLGKHSDEEDESVAAAADSGASQRFLRNALTSGASARLPSMKPKRRVEKTYMRDGFLVCEEVTEDDEEEDPPAAAPEEPQDGSRGHKPAAAAPSPVKLPQKRKGPEAEAEEGDRKEKEKEKPKKEKAAATKKAAATAGGSAASKKKPAAAPKNTLLNYFK